MKQYRLVLTAIFLLVLLACNRNQAKKINWSHDIAAAIEKSEEKPVMVDFMAEWCPPCQRMEETSFSNPQVIKRSEKFVMVRINIEKQKDIAVQYNGNASKYGGIGIPNILFLNGKGEKLRHIVGYRDGNELIAVMDSVLSGKYEAVPID